jgi:AcrR family transcriptional regulator
VESNSDLSPRKPVRCRLDDVEHLVAKGAHQLLGVNAPDHAGREIFFDAVGRSKEHLYEECISYYMENVAPHIWDGFRKAATARAAVEAFLQDSANVLPGMNKPSGCMVTLSDARGEGSEHLGQFVEEARRQGLLLVERKIEDGVATGEISSGANPAAIARYFLSVQQGMSIQARDGSTVRELREVADAAMKAWPTLTQGRQCL